MVFLLFGVTKRAHAAGSYNMFCSNCQANIVHTAILEKSAGTFFFIPLIPLGSKRKLTCNRCNFTQTSWEMVKHPYAIPVGMVAPPKPSEMKPRPKPVRIDMPPYPPAPPKRLKALNAELPVTRKAAECPACGTALVPGDEFCGSCGEEVEL